MPSKPSRWPKAAWIALLLAAMGGSGLAYRWWVTEPVIDPLAVRLAEADAQAKRRQLATTRPVQYQAHERWLNLDGVVNARDVGGYPTTDGRRIRWNLVYRSGELTRMTPAGCELFNRTGVRRIIDYRNRAIISSGFGGDAECVFELAEMSLLPIRGDLQTEDRATYSQLLHANADSFRQSFELIADPANLPILYHCAGGKDRTGIMTQLLLSLLGVDRATITADYELSRPVAGELRPAEFQAIFDEIDAAGGIEKFLATLGVAPAIQKAVRTNLLEPAATRSGPTR